MQLDDKIALVTGAASGIGRAIAERFAEEGASVVALDHDHAVVSERPRGAALSLVSDVADKVQVEASTRRVSEQLGGYDILVNAAGVVVTGRAGECSEAEWERVFAVNAKGAWLMCRAALARMAESGGGAIVNVASGAGLRVLEGLCAYSASKAAVISLTRSIALEYGDAGIRANCICPGIVDTPMAHATLHGQATSLADAVERYVVKRPGRSEEIAATALLLASPEVGFLTGATLAVDGGRTLH